MISLEGIEPNMIAQNLEPLIASHPGELLKEELECRGISQKKFSEVTGIPYTALNEVLNCKRAVNTEYALLIEAALGISADMWLNMQQDFNKFTAKRNISFMEKIRSIQQFAAML